MNNIVKIILGLNIAAGGAGIFFGMTKSGKVGDLKQAKVDAEGKAATAMKGQRDAEGKFKTEAQKVTTLQGEKANLELENSNLQKSAGGSQGQIDAAKEAQQTAEAAAKTANRMLMEAEKLARKVPGLEGKLTDYENIKFKGEKLSLTDIQEKLAQLEKLTKGPEVTEPEPEPEQKPGGLIGAIQSHDAALDFYVINAGRDNGVKLGDQFLVTAINNKKPLGYIEISRVQPSVSIAVYKKGFPRPSAPFQSGYKVWKSSL